MHATLIIVKEDTEKPRRIRYTYTLLMPSGDGDKIETVYPVGDRVEILPDQQDDLNEILKKFRKIIDNFSLTPISTIANNSFKKDTSLIIGDLSDFIKEHLFPKGTSIFAEHFMRLEKFSKDKIVHLQIITNDFQIPWWLANCYIDSTMKLCECFALGILPLKSSYNPDSYKFSGNDENDCDTNEITPEKVPIALISRPTEDLKGAINISKPISKKIDNSSKIYPIEINVKDGLREDDPPVFIGINATEGKNIFDTHQVVIYNGHFCHNPKDPRGSFFEFSKKRNPLEKEKLYLNKFVYTNEKVVILCGCNTVGLTTESIESEDPSTPNLAELYDAFHWICIGTLYPIFQDSTKVFLESFVNYSIEKGLSIGEALRKTRLEMKENSELDISDWCPYILLGPVSALLPGIKKQNILFSFPTREKKLLENIINNENSFFTFSFNSDPKRAANLGLTNDFSNHTIEIGIEPITTVFKDILEKPDSTKILGVAYSTKNDMYLVIDKKLGISSFGGFDEKLKERKIKILTNKSDLPRALFVRLLLNKKYKTNNNLLELCKHEDCSQCKKIHLCWVELPLDYYNAFCCGFGDGAILRRTDIPLSEISVGQEIQIESGGYKRDVFVIECVDNLLNEVARSENISVEIPLTAWVARIKQGKSFEDISIKYAIREFCRNIPENQEMAEKSVVLQKTGDIKTNDVDVIQWLFNSSSALGDLKAEDWNIISNSFLDKEGNKFSK